MRHPYLKTVFLVAIALILPLTSPAAERPEYLASFDPARGFKPAQRDLTEVFLQIAGSLEYYGSPVPYMQHMAQEHERIEALYRAKFGTAPRSLRPDYMTDDYLNHFATNWNYLSPKLGLDPFAKEVGNTMRDAISGTRGTGTMIVQILNDHQSRVFDSMAGKGVEGADFDTLKSQLISRLELDKPDVDEGKYEPQRRDAVRSAIIIQGMTMKLLNRLDQNLKPGDSQRLKNLISSMYLDVGRMAQSELEAAFLESALQHSTAAK